MLDEIGMLFVFFASERAHALANVGMGEKIGGWRGGAYSALGAIEQILGLVIPGFGFGGIRVRIWKF